MQTRTQGCHKPVLPLPLGPEWPQPLCQSRSSAQIRALLHSSCRAACFLMPGLALYTGSGPCALNAGPGAFDAGRVRLPHGRACVMRWGCSMADRALNA